MLEGLVKKFLRKFNSPIMSHEAEIVQPSDEVIDQGGLAHQASPSAAVMNTFKGLSKQRIEETLDGQPLPRYLYHYTSSSGLLGILGNHSLWFTQSTFLNDGSESTHGVDIISQAIDTFINDKSDAEKLIAQKLKDEVAGVTRYFQPAVFCMSAEDNLLNQWRDYGKDVVPYCLELDYPKLQESTNGSFSLYLAKVIYDYDRQIQLTTGLLSDIYRVTKAIILGREISPEEERGLLIGAAVELMILAYRFKNPAFQAEKEWRMICEKPQLAEKVKPKFRSSVLGVLPYFEWCQEQNGERERLPISHVTVGPSPYSAVSDVALKQFLEASGYHIPTHYSTIPIRR